MNQHLYTGYGENITAVKSDNNRVWNKHYHWRMIKASLLIIFLNFLFLVARSNPGDTTIVKKNYFTKELIGAITLDGTPSEEAWNAVEWGGDFIQEIPNEGKPPSQQTNFKILYDDKFLYIAYRCHDLSP